MTVQLDTHFLSAAHAGQFLEARGQVVRVTSRLVFMRGQIAAAGADLVTANALLMVMEKPSDPALG